MSDVSAKPRIRLSASFWRHTNCVPFTEDIVPSSLFLKNRHYLVVDIETQKLIQEVGGWENMTQLGISVVCAYDSKTDQFSSYLEKDLPALFALCYQRLVVGYNVKGFDIPIMATYGLDPQRLDVFDMMLDLEAITRQRYFKLDAVAKGTLGESKSADGLMAVQWWKEKKIDLIIEYCLQDVKVTRDIFEFGRKNNVVQVQRAGDKILSVPVSWD
jgi:DEAD/DEAH box helicase domain-containing protein